MDGGVALCVSSVSGSFLLDPRRLTVLSRCDQALLHRQSFCGTPQERCSCRSRCHALTDPFEQGPQRIMRLRSLL